MLFCCAFIRLFLYILVNNNLLKYTFYRFFVAEFYRSSPKQRKRLELDVLVFLKPMGVFEVYSTLVYRTSLQFILPPIKKSFVKLMFTCLKLKSTTMTCRQNRLLYYRLIWNVFYKLWFVRYTLHSITSI